MIEEFHTLLTSGKDDNPLLTALREFMAIKKPEEIAAAILESGLGGFHHWLISSSRRSWPVGFPEIAGVLFIQIVAQLI
jgi:hypothetical protein